MTRKQWINTSQRSLCGFDAPRLGMRISERVLGNSRGNRMNSGKRRDVEFRMVGRRGGEVRKVGGVSSNTKLGEAKY